MISTLTNSWKNDFRLNTPEPQRCIGISFFLCNALLVVLLGFESMPCMFRRIILVKGGHSHIVWLCVHCFNCIWVLKNKHKRAMWPESIC